MPLLHDVIRVEETLRGVINAADEAVTSSLAEVALGNGEVHPHSEEEIRKRSEGVASENANTDDGPNNNVNEGNDDSPNGTFANTTDSDGNPNDNPDGSQNDGESDSWSDTSEWSGIHDSDGDVEMEEDEEIEDHQEMSGDEEMEEDQDVEGDQETEDKEGTEDNEEMNDQGRQTKRWMTLIRSNHGPDQHHDDATSSSISAEGATDVFTEMSDEDGSPRHNVSSPVLGENTASSAAMAGRVTDNDDDEEEEGEELDKS
ncbi:hypothetical protein QBC45DRAFT_446443 [Copromyces sp. CBS 386.78]|nr:hypothetical protein QBC45DRAFT_446443 [Copromyces sp. CBS 386.78]